MAGNLDMGEVRKVLGDPDTHGLVLLTVILDAFGDRVFGDPDQELEPMDPAEIWAGINEIYGTWIPEEGENKVNALLLAMTSGLFYHDPQIFEAVTAALYDGDIADMIGGVFDKPSLIEMLWAITEVELANDEEQGPPDFGRDVQNYIDELMRIEGHEFDRAAAVVNDEFHDMMETLRRIGVPMAALRLLDREHAETMASLDPDPAADVS